MTTFGFLIDNRKCIGCHACTIACKSEHEVPLGVDRTWVKYIEKGEFPNNRRMFSVMRCNHCDRAPCVTICPVTALYRRADGVVDFNSDRCIGCKSCLQACPYDALYIDPDTNTAAKCNFCTHRLEVGLQPSCVVVCPEQAIVCGDLDNSESELSKLIERHPVQVRKPEKGTQPKLCYIDADEASLVPLRTSNDEQMMWSRGDSASSAGAEPASVGGHGTQPVAVTATVEAPPDPRRVYDTRKREALWGWPVALYTWTKSLATGGSLAALAMTLLETKSSGDLRLPLIGTLALIFLAVTVGLLVADLKKPSRFLYVLLRPQWKSWLVRGAYLLVGYGAFLTAWLVSEVAHATLLSSIFLWAAAILAIPSAVYTAFLFSQAKGRDLWQSPLLVLHLLVHALLAGAVLWIIVELPDPSTAAQYSLAVTIGFSLLMLAAELFSTHPTEEGRRAWNMMIRRPWGVWFWGLGVGVGHLVPLLLLLTQVPAAAILAALAALAGLLTMQRLWVHAPQQIPLS